MVVVEQKTGFDAPQRVKTEYMADLYRRHGLGDSPSLRDIEPVATKLLSNPRTAIAGTELVLGRRVDAKEKEVASIAVTPGLSGEDRLGLLLMQKEIEKIQGTKS